MASGIQGIDLTYRRRLASSNTNYLTRFSSVQPAWSFLTRRLAANVENYPQHAQISALQTEVPHAYHL